MRGPALAAALAAACAGAPAGHTGPVVATAVLHGRTFACSQGGVFEHGERLRRVADPGFRPFALAVRGAVDGIPDVLLVGGGAPAQSGELALFGLEGRRLAQAHVAGDLVYAVALAPVQALAAAAGADGALTLWSLPDLSPRGIRWRHAGPAVAVAFSPDGAMLASAGHDGAILLGEPLGEGPPASLLDHTAAATCLQWSPDGRRLASGARDGKVRLHDRSGRLVRTWQRLGGEVATVAFGAEGLDYTLVAAPGAAARGGTLDLP